jgi:hypothetical protein
MTSLVASIRSVVDFSSYSSSPLITGYIELNGMGSVAPLVHALASCIKAEKFDVVGKAMHEGRKKVQHDHPHIDHHFYDTYIEPILSLGLNVESTDISNHDWDLIDGFVDPLVEPVDAQQLEKIAIWRMFGGGLHGHLFVVLDAIDAVAYFAQDPEVGFIGFSQAGQANIDAFIQKLLLTTPALGSWNDLRRR